MIIFAAVCSCAETTYYSVSKIRMRTLSQEGNKKARIVEQLLANSDRFFGAILVVINIVNIGASSFSTAFVISVFGEGGAIVAYATGVVTLIILVFVDIVPKNLAMKNAESIALFLARFMQIVYYLISPIVIVLNQFSLLFIRLLGGNQTIGPTLTEEDLKTIVTVGHEEGVLEEEEKDMLHNVFTFAETEIREIMTPRIHVDSISDDCSYEQLMEIYQESQYSRYPVHSDSFDEIIGVLNMKDLLFNQLDPATFDIKKYMRDTFVVYEFNQISDVFTRMRKQHVTLAVVLDEYGVMSGIVTFEDIIEEIVGEIDDEYDKEEEVLIKQTGAHEYLIDGGCSIHDVNEVLNTNFNSEEFESIGGLLLGHYSRGLPTINNCIVINGVSFRIIEMDKNRIALLRVTILQTDTEDK